MDIKVTRISLDGADTVEVEAATGLTLAETIAVLEAAETLLEIAFRLEAAVDGDDDITAIPALTDKARKVAEGAFAATRQAVRAHNAALAEAAHQQALEAEAAGEGDDDEEQEDGYIDGYMAASGE